MGIKCGIVGLPNVGKSTLFNALTRAAIAAENYPFCTIDPNVGIVPASASHAGVPTGNLGLRAFHCMRSVVLFAAQKSPLSMPSLTHALNIGTLAVWTSVATLGSLGAMLGRAGNFPVITDAVGVELAPVLPALAGFRGVKRRLERVGQAAGASVYDDFAHHPTAIATTLAGLRARVGQARIVVAMEPRSNSMKLGAHREGLADSVSQADRAIWYAPASLGWDLAASVAGSTVPSTVCDSLEGIIVAVKGSATPGTQVVIMSNGGFGGLHGKLAKALAE